MVTATSRLGWYPLSEQDQDRDTDEAQGVPPRGGRTRTESVQRLGETASRLVVGAHAQGHRADNPEAIGLDEAARWASEPLGGD